MAFITIHGDYENGNALDLTIFMDVTIPSNIKTELDTTYGMDFEITIDLDVNIPTSRIYYLDSMMQEIEVPFTGNSAKFELTFEWGEQEIDVYLEQNTPQPPIDVSGFNNLYLMTIQKLKELAHARFTVLGTDIDLGEYILNVLELPFKVDESILGNESEIELGSHKMGVNAVKLINDSMVIDFGTITVPHKYNNTYDYINTTAKLFLPYTNDIVLDIEYVIGCDVGIQYIIDLYSGDTTVNINSSRLGKIVNSESVKLGRDIPFIANKGGNTMNKLSTVNGVQNGILSPYIEIIRNKLVNETNVFDNPATSYEQLLNVNGFISVENVLLNSNAHAIEKIEIVNKLRNGVYIK